MKQHERTKQIRAWTHQVLTGVKPQKLVYRWKVGEKGGIWL